MNNEPALRSRLAHLRKEVDTLDLQFLDILAKRIAVVQELSVYKCALGIPLRDAEREEELVELHSLWAERLGLPQTLVRELFSVVLQSSRELQASLRRGPVEMAVHLNESASARKIRA
ncbi:MAG TPA: chorismate mutase [Thermoanaerobaculia bacterium]|nr:chorismate mutase [Thermoanaerobaculia bacterium]